MSDVQCAVRYEFMAYNVDISFLMASKSLLKRSWLTKKSLLEILLYFPYVPEAIARISSFLWRKVNTDLYVKISSLFGHQRHFSI